MKTISGTPIVEQFSKIPRSNLEALEGKKIFTDKLTHFIQLTKNIRAESAGEELSPLAKFTRLARLGKVRSVLASINTCVVNSPEVAMRDAHAEAVWITSTHRRINAINEAFLDALTKDGSCPKTRLIAKHVPSKPSVNPPAPATRHQLYSMGGGAKSQGGGVTAQMPTYMDLCIGSRVRIVKNLSTQCGLYNGAMGTVWGFVYEGSGPQTAEERVPSNFSSLEDHERELPIVLVRIDGDDADFPHSCSPAVTRLIPIVPIADTHRLVAFQNKYTRFMLPILPAHARTGHSVQGYMAINGVVVDPGSMFYAGDYVALSRAKDIKDVRLLAAAQEKYFTSHPEYRMFVHAEYLRLLNAFPARDICSNYSAEASGVLRKAVVSNPSPSVAVSFPSTLRALTTAATNNTSRPAVAQDCSKTNAPSFVKSTSSKRGRPVKSAIPGEASPVLHPSTTTTTTTTTTSSAVITTTTTTTIIPLAMTAAAATTTTVTTTTTSLDKPKKKTGLQKTHPKAVQKPELVVRDVNVRTSGRKVVPRTVVDV
jgi:hypothetical protein